MGGEGKTSGRNILGSAWARFFPGGGEERSYGYSLCGEWVEVGTRNTRTVRQELKKNDKGGKGKLILVVLL